jgi:hypothetical protein
MAVTVVVVETAYMEMEETVVRAGIAVLDEVVMEGMVETVNMVEVEMEGMVEMDLMEEVKEVLEVGGLLEMEVMDRTEKKNKK